MNKNILILICILGITSNLFGQEISWKIEPTLKIEVEKVVDVGAVIKKNGLFGFVDIEGNIVIPTIYDKIISHKEYVLSTKERYLRVEKNNKKGYYKINGEPITLIEFDIDEKEYIISSLLPQGLSLFSEGVVGVCKDKKCGFVDENGKILIPFEYEHVEKFSNNIANVKKDGRWGFINKENKVIIPFKYQQTWHFENDVIGIKHNNKWSIVNKKGKKITSIKYDDVTDLENGLIGVISNDKWGVINKKGEKIIPTKYDDIDDEEEGNGLITMMKNNKWGCLDENGKVVIPFIYDEIITDINELYYFGYSNFNPNILTKNVKRNGKWGVIDLEGKQILPIEYDKITNLSDKYFSVELNKKKGIVDKKGQFIAPIKYDFIQPYFVKGLIVVAENGKFGVIDEKGQIVIPITYDGAFISNENRILVKKGSQGGVLSNNQDIIVPFDEYENISHFSDFPNIILIKKDAKWKFFNQNHRMIIPNGFDDLYFFRSQNLIWVKEGDKLGIININK